jgi:hypothetical protein
LQCFQDVEESDIKTQNVSSEADCNIDFNKTILALKLTDTGNGRICTGPNTLLSDCPMYWICVTTAKLVLMSGRPNENAMQKMC